jgi:PAS domain S-box-containing protein
MSSKRKAMKGSVEATLVEDLRTLRRRLAKVAPPAGEACERCHSGECYCTMIASIPVGIAVLDADGALIDANPAMVRMTGYSIEELRASLGHTLCVDEGTRAVLRSALAAEGRVHAPEVAVRRRDGSVWRAALYLDHAKFGKRDILLVVARDAILQARAEEAVRESEEHFRGIFEDSPVSLWVEDLSAVKARLDELIASGAGDLRRYLEEHPSEVVRCASMIKVLDVNRATLELYGAESKADLVRDVNKVLAPQSYEAFQEELLAMAAGLTSFETESVNRTLRGELKQISVRLSVAPGDEETYSRVLVSITDITTRKEAEKELLRHQEQLRSLASQLSLAEQRERRRISAELHDSIGQNLALAKIKLGGLRQQLESAGAMGNLDEVRQLIDESLEQTRSLVFQLSPPVLYELGLEQAIEWLAEQMQQRHGLHTEVHRDRAAKPLDEEVSIVLFQAVRELLLNVAKHAQATCAAVTVAREDGSVRITVDDDGIGFSPEDVLSLAGGPRGFGLFNIRERLELLGGRLDIASSAERGTSAVVTAPLKPVLVEREAMR